jgi:hypothetical protein
MNILKTRDDPGPSVIQQTSGLEFSLVEGEECTWAEPGETFGPSKLRERIEPWLTALFQSDHLSLLIGSGLMLAMGALTSRESIQGMSPPTFSFLDDRISKAAEVSARMTGRVQANFEDKIRVANEILQGLRHYSAMESETDGSGGFQQETKQLARAISEALEQFAYEILQAESVIVESKNRDEAFGYLVNFLMSPASRSGTRERLQVFTTNYDRLIEAGADVAGIHLIDRFVGSITPLLRASRLGIDMHYNPPGIRGEPRYLEGVVRFTKLHGSLDWLSVGREIRRMGSPFGAGSIEHYLSAPGLTGADVMDLMIYPNAAKDRETSEYPYVDLFRDFAAAICRPNSTVVTYGFGFGDEHIIRVVEDMLTIPSTHLVIISYDDPADRIMGFYNRVNRPAQMTLLIGNHLGDLRTLVGRYLPKPAIDRTTYRMTELLKSRYGELPQGGASESQQTDKGSGDDS